MFTQNFWNCFEAFTEKSTLASNTYAYMTNMQGTVSQEKVIGTSNRVNYLLGFGATSDPTTYSCTSLYLLSNNTAIYYGTSNTQSYPAIRGVILGTGTTPATVNDYALSGTQITDFTATTAVSIDSTGKYEVAGIYVITNTSATDFTIGEVALTRYNEWEGTAPSNRFILERTVLTTPLTIPAGETKTLVYRIGFGTSSASEA